jgi:hypothetical protein
LLVTPALPRLDIALRRASDADFASAPGAGAAAIGDEPGAEDREDGLAAAVVPLTSLAVLSAFLIAAFPPRDIALRLARAISRLVARPLFVAVATCDMMNPAVNRYSLILNTDGCR